MYVYLITVWTILLYSDMLDVYVRFDPTYYTTTETKGSVTVWIHVDEGVTEPFTVALLPEEGDLKYRYEGNSLFFCMQGLRSLITINQDVM